MATRRDPGPRGSGRPRRASRRGIAVAAAQGADDRRRRKILSQEFDDISISKIRYLEDQKLLAPAPHSRRIPPLQPDRRRAPARDPADAARRVPAAAGDPPGTGHRRLHEAASRVGRAATGDVGRARRRDHHPGGAARAGRGRARRSCASCRSSESSSPAGATAGPTSTRPTSRSCAPPPSSPPSASPGATCGCFRTSADREAALLEQLLSASLRSRSQARRKEAIENLESLAAISGHLKQLLLVRDLRRLTVE